MEFSQPECESGISVPGALKLDHLQPVEPILFGNFPIISFSYLGPILITPESGGLKMGKWNSPNLSARVGSQCLGHSNWTIYSLLSQFCLEIFPIISLSYWGPILITPESGGLKMGIWNSPNLSVRVGSLCPRHSNWTICSLLSQFFGNFSNYFTFILGGQFLLHQRVEDSIRENGILPT